MTVRHMGTHGERSVEQQYTLLGPACEVAVRRHGLTEVVVDLLEDIDK